MASPVLYFGTGEVDTYTHPFPTSMCYPSLNITVSLEIGNSDSGIHILRQLEARPDDKERSQDAKIGAEAQNSPA